VCETLEAHARGDVVDACVLRRACAIAATATTTTDDARTTRAVRGVVMRGARAWERAHGESVRLASARLRRARGTPASREANGVDGAREIAMTCEASVLAHCDVVDGGEEGNVRREIAALALGGLARARGDGDAAATLGRAPNEGRALGAALARWLTLRLVNREGEKMLTNADLARLAAVVSKNPESAAARAFCEFGGLSALCAFIDVGGDAASLSPAALFDAAKATASLCSSATARFDSARAREELSAILASASGKMSDPLPAVAATMLRQALGALERRSASARGVISSVSLERLPSASALGDCRPAREVDDDASSDADARRPGELASFGSQIELSRSRSSQGTLGSSSGSASAFGADVRADVRSPALERKRSSSNVLLHGKSSKSPSKGGSRMSAAPRRRLARRALWLVALVGALGCLFFFLSARARASIIRRAHRRA